MSAKSFVTPSLKQLESEFEFVRNSTHSTHSNIKGVWYITSKKPGPVLGITIHTHGNEPSGLAALWYFRNKFELERKLINGSIFFVLNNIKATKNYFSAVKMKNEEKKKNARFCDLNMNRMPENMPYLKADSRYEIRRAQELLPIWSQFTTAFDIHSVSVQSKPMIIACRGLQENLIRGFPVEIIITNIEKVQIDKPAVSFYGKKGKIRTLAIEAGSHEDSSSFEYSIACTKALLINLGMIQGKKNTHQKEYDEYFIDGSLLFPHKSFKMSKIFEMFEPIAKDQVLGQGKGTKIVAKFKGHALMGRKTLKPESIKEEVLFLSRPVKKIII